MALPSGALSITDINAELGATVSTTPRSMNDDEIRYLTAGSGKSINTTSTSAISMADLQTGYLSQYNEYWTFGNPPVTTVPTCVYSDVRGNIYLGTTSGQLYKMTPSGRILWSTDVSASIPIKSIVTDSALNVYVRYVERTVNKFITITSNYIVKYNSAGVLQWQLTPPGTNLDFVDKSPAGGLTIDSNDILYVSDGSPNVYKINSSGTLLSAVSLGGTVIPDTLNGVATGSGYLYVVGTTSVSSNVHAYIAQINPSTMALNWSARSSSNISYYSSSPSVDSTGQLCVTATGVGSSPINKSVVLTTNTSGGVVWSTQIQTSANSAIGQAGTALDPNNNVYVGGYVYATSNLDIIVSKLSSNGSHQWTRSYRNTNQGMNEWSLSIDATGNRVLISGYSSNSSGYIPSLTSVNQANGATAVTAGNFAVVAYTPTITASPSGWTSLTTVSSTISASNNTLSNSSLTITANTTFTQPTRNEFGGSI